MAKISNKASNYNARRAPKTETVSIRCRPPLLHDGKVNTNKGCMLPCCSGAVASKLNWTSYSPPTAKSTTAGTSSETASHVHWRNSLQCD